MHLPATVTISALESSDQFDVHVVNDGEVDGDQTLVVAVSAADYPNGTAPITVLDDDTPEDRTLGGYLFGDISAHAYRVLFDIHVDAGDTLTIASGSTLKFEPGTALRVEGALTAVGDTGSEIAYNLPFPLANCSGSDVELPLERHTILPRFAESSRDDQFGEK